MDLLVWLLLCSLSLACGFAVVALFVRGFQRDSRRMKEQFEAQAQAQLKHQRWEAQYPLAALELRRREQALLQQMRQQQSEEEALFWMMEDGDP